MEENQVHIPDGWESYVGNEILKVQGGYAFKSNDYKAEGILLVRIGNVGNGYFVFKDVIYVPKRFQITHSNFQLWKGDVLMGLTGDLGKICILKDGNFPYFLNQRVGRFIPTDKIDNEYLFYLVSSSFVQSKFDAFFAGGAQKNISPKQIESISYVIPKSKPEQTTIARILSKVDEAIARTEQLMDKYTRIKTGLMQDLLTKGIDEHGNIRTEETHEFKDSPLGRIPMEWEVPTIDNIKEFITSGSRGWAQYYSVEGSQFIRITNLKRKQIEIDKTEMKFVKLPVSAEGMRSKLQVGDLLISITADLGIIGIVPADFGDAFVNQHIALVRLNQDDIYPDFIGYFLCSQQGQRMFNLLNDGGAKAGLNLNTVGNIPVIKPSKTEQILNVERIEAVNKTVGDFQKQLIKFQSLKTGLMQDLLSGKVRVNHLIKEKASV